MQCEIHAHRGARSFFPENTISAFLKAVELGVDAIEFDLCISADNRVVVSHDPYMKAGLCAAPDGRELTKKDEALYVLYKMKYSDIARFNCGCTSAEFPRQEKVQAVKPLLENVFRSVEQRLEKLQRAGGVIYNLEVKSGAKGDGLLHPPPQEYSKLVCTVIKESGVSSRIRVQSFDARILREARKILPALCLGLLVRRWQNPETELNRLGFKPDYLNPFFPMVNRNLIEMLHEQGIRIVPWTVNVPETMKALARMGADGIITDHPEIALEILNE